MNIRNISGNQIFVWSALVIGLIAAIVIGSAVGNSDVRFVAAIFAAIPVAVIFVQLKTNIWVLLPLGWYLTGRLPWLPLPLSVRDMCFLMVIICFTLFFATRALPLKRKLSTLDYFIYINLVYLIIVYVRNPVGFWAIQSDMVGGRAYFEIGLAFGAFIVLSRIEISQNIARLFPSFFLIPSWCIGILDVTGRLSPTWGYALHSMYTGVGSRDVMTGFQEEAQLGETRMTGLMNAGKASILALCSKYNPVTLISPVYPARALMMLAGFGAIFLSGFRSALLFGFATYLLSAVLRGRLRDLWVSSSVALLLLISLILLQGNVLQLPRTMQRALSWMPGDWDQTAVSSAEESSVWRFEMWEWAWNDDRIMRNRLWGQGFGLSLDDMNLIAAMLTSGSSGQRLLGGSDREQFMMTGTLHSGPLSTIKYIGIVGLALFLGLICYMTVDAWRLCKRARGTSAFPLALFVSIPIIYEPFQFVFIFGALEGSYPQTVFWAGLLNMVSNHVKSIKSNDRSKVLSSRSNSASGQLLGTRHMKEFSAIKTAQT